MEITKLPKTKAERHEIYKELLVRTKNPDQRYFAICGLLRLLISWKSELTAAEVLFHLPELREKRPKKFHAVDTEAYWFPLTPAGRAKRIELIKRCIEETKPIRKTKISPDDKERAS